MLASSLLHVLRVKSERKRLKAGEVV